MAIKLAFSTVACPDWSLDQTVTQAAESGYGGIELRTLGDTDSQLASDPILSDADKIKQTLQAAGITPVCLSTSISLHYTDQAKANQAVSEVIRQMALAAKIGCPAVRVFGNEVAPGEPRREAMARIADRVKSILSDTKHLPVQLLFENAGSFAAAKDWWTILSLIESTRAGVCWNLANSVAANIRDAGGAISVSTLNHRIRLAKIKDAIIGEGKGFLPLGEGNVGIEKFVKRLMGVGFGGYLCVEWDRLWLPTLAPAEEFIPKAAETIKGWQAEIDELQEKAVKLNDKAMKKVAPKARPRLKKVDQEVEQTAEAE